MFAGQTISCSAKANPPPTMTMTMKATKSINGTTSIQIPKNTKLGNYTFVCRARNKVGESTRAVIMLVRSECD